MTPRVHALEPFAPIDLTAPTLTEAIGVASGAPTASLVLPIRAGGEVGVLKMGRGHLYDTAEDEVFIVRTGEAPVTLLSEDNEELQHITARPGTVCRLTEGMRTHWETTTPLRQLCLPPTDDEDPS